MLFFRSDGDKLPAVPEKKYRENGYTFRINNLSIPIYQVVVGGTLNQNRVRLPIRLYSQELGSYQRQKGLVIALR